MGIKIVTHNLAEMQNSRTTLAHTKRRDEDCRFDSAVSELRDLQNWNDSSMVLLYEQFIKDSGLCLEAAMFLQNRMEEENKTEENTSTTIGEE